MDDRNAKGTPLAVVLSAVLHLGIVAFLFLAMLSCTSYEAFLTALHLPNPITCNTPIQLTGPVIEATLIGNTAAPPPKSVKVKPIPNTTPPPPTMPPPPLPPQPPVPKVDQLPPPPKNPDNVDQEKIVQQGDQKADEAKKEQEEKERQRQADLDAKAAARQKAIEEYDKLMAQAQAINTQQKKNENLAKQAQQQLKDAENAKDNGQPDLPNAPDRMTGNNSPNSDLLSQYKAAIYNAVKPNWIITGNVPNAPCVVHIVQIPGGQVLSAKADSSCPYDAAGKQSIENAVLRSQPLPYKGFESVFQRELIFTFRPDQ